MDDSTNESLKRRIKEARIKFSSMGATYFAGVLNDNFFRQCALLMAVTADKSHLQGYATVIFTLPFILFAAPAGFCADRFSKRSIVIASKILELTAMIIAAIGIYYLNWILIMVTLFVMGLQSTLFGPSLRGTIPELYPAEYVVKANAIIRMLSTGAILAGIAIAGVVLDREGTVGQVPLGQVLAASSVVGMALIGLIVSFGVPKFPAAAPKTRFPWFGPLNSLITLYKVRSDKLLAVVIKAKAFFWFIGSLQILVINKLGVEQFGLTRTLTSGLIVVELVGIAVGSMLSLYLAKGKRWYRVLGPAAITMALCMFIMAIIPHLLDSIRKSMIIGTLGILGVAGGVFSVPLASFIQVRPSADVKGKIISASMFADFMGILISGPVFYLLDAMKIKPSNCFAVKAVMVTIVVIWLLFALPKRSSDD
ncbi:MAG: MFS transporter [Planctomycetota bacterium]|jgi:acyl-[acyl-carrier-protein]-phospholipid O-acyltransferase/long-chain-fatty-acid--[acyl-carrier-protein] ligase